MKFTGADFALIRWSVLAICSALVLGGTMLFASVKYASAVDKAQRTAQSALNDARKRLAMAREDKENLSDYSARYAALERSDIIGDDHRLDWMESMENLRNQNLVINFRYNISPQKTYSPQPALDSGNFDIHFSETKFQFDLLHEGQLVNFFKALRKQSNGWFQLEGCTLKRIDLTDQSATAAGPNILAQCSGGWITLKNRSTQ